VAGHANFNRGEMVDEVFRHYGRRGTILKLGHMGKRGGEVGFEFSYMGQEYTIKEIELPTGESGEPFQIPGKKLARGEVQR